MENIALRQLLESLCNSSCWKYAVFWKLHHESPMLLTWEEWYYDFSKLSEPMGSILGDCCFRTTNKMFCPKSQTSAHEESSSGCPIALAVADMSNLQYPLGEGAVGEVAYSGNHCWHFCDEWDSLLVLGFPDEWRLQLLGGIKTILLVPVVPLGVLQLGSLEKVSEDLAMVAFVKDRFGAFQNNFSIPFPLSSNFVAQPSSLIMPGCVENLAAITVATNNITKGLEYEELKAVANVQISNNQISTRNEPRPQYTVQDALLASEKDILDILNVENADVIDVSSVDFVKALTSNHVDQLKIEKSAEPTDRILNSYSHADMIEQLLKDNNAFDEDPTTTSSYLKHPTESELHKVLAPDLRRWTDDYMWDLPVTSAGASSSSNPIFTSDLTCPIELPAWESSDLSFKTDDENLLEALFTSLYSGVDNTLSDSSNSILPFETSFAQIDPPKEAANQSKKSALLGYDSVPWNNMAFTSQSLYRVRNALTNSPANASSFKSVGSSFADEQLQSKGYGSTMQSRKGAKLSKVNKRRSVPGENQRQRPRDRQMIQDRVKELRELVPNGAKCSIDGLLERTIKHMLFLRSVSDRAEKFKRWNLEEVDGMSEWKSSTRKGAGQSGTSRAFQLGDELEVCPIVVEDLEYPGHILIEMLCSEHGLFLEIAQVIRGLNLTILDGKIESHSGNTWARFIVEASSGFHRMDIFWPLMHLFRRNNQSISSKI